MQQPVRVLIPWFDRDEAITALLNFRVPEPGQDVNAQVQEYERLTANLAARPAYNRPAPALEAIPAQLNERIVAFNQRADVQSAFNQLQWEVGVVNLDHVLSFQKAVALEQAAERVAAVNPDDWESLFALCLPESRPEQFQGTLDQDGKAITMSSLNPNLRSTGNIIQDVNVAPQPGQPGQTMKFIGFGIHLGTSFIQVAEYNGRWFVRDGYHRCYALLARGISRIPCVFIRARNFAEVGADNPAFFNHERLLGDRPPFLRDFLDDNFSMALQRAATRKVVRVSVEEFVVHV